MQCLHRAEAAAHYGGETLNTQAIRQARLGRDPIFNGHHGKARTIGMAGFRIDRRWAGRTETAAQIIDADNKETISVERLAGTDHVVPPADVLRIVGIVAGYVMGGVERMADQHRVRLGGVQRSVGLENQIVGLDRRPGTQFQWRIEMQRSRRDTSDRQRIEIGREMFIHSALGVHAVDQAPHFIASVRK